MIMKSQEGIHLMNLMHSHRRVCVLFLFIVTAVLTCMRFINLFLACDQSGGEEEHVHEVLTIHQHSPNIIRRLIHQ